MTHLNAPIRDLRTSFQRFLEPTANALIDLAEALKSAVVKIAKLLWCVVASVLEFVRSV